MKKNFVINSAKQLLNSATTNLNVIAKNETNDSAHLVKGTGTKEKDVCCDWWPSFQGLQPNTDQLALS